MFFFVNEQKLNSVIKIKKESFPGCKNFESRYFGDL
jgi:hypothetical protein